MKTILLPILFKIIFLDPQTNESLSGVRIETNEKIYYSDLKGEVQIPKEQKIKNISYVSYQTLEKLTLNSDTIISLSQLK
jgi:hypothetical protein